MTELTPPQTRTPRRADAASLNARGARYIVSRVAVERRTEEAPWEGSGHSGGPVTQSPTAFRLLFDQASVPAVLATSSSASRASHAFCAAATP